MKSLFVTSQTNSDDLPVARLTKSSHLRPTLFLALSSLVLLSIILLTFILWHFVNQQQLEKINQNAQQNLALYSSKIEQELGTLQQSLLPVVASHPAIIKYLTSTAADNETSLLQTKQAQAQLMQLHAAFENKAVFIGNTQQFLQATADVQADSLLFDSIKQSLTSRALKGKKTVQLLFTPNEGVAKFLIAQPVKRGQKIIGYIGMLLDLTSLQKQLETSLVSDEEVLMVSDERGIILLSSKADWLFQSFSNLPYNLKKSIYAQFESKQLFTQLGSVNIDEGILTTNTNNDGMQEQSYLVRSILLQGYPLRLHHLANINSVEKQGVLSIIILWFCFFLLALMLLFLKTKRRIQSEKLSLEYALQQRNNEFKHQQKLASLGMVATTIAHEINQPITAIKTEANIGCKYNERGDSEQVKHSFATIVEYTQLLATITAQLKDFARKRKSSSSNLANIGQTIKQSIALNASRLQSEQVTCCVGEIGENLYGKIDNHQLQQVLSNLIQNACDAMKTCSEKQIIISVKTLADSISIDVTDTGIGIDEDKQKSVFDAFVSSKKQTSSMGLGLAICQDILSHFGGSISVVSPVVSNVSESRGANFKINLLAEHERIPTSQY